MPDISQPPEPAVHQRDQPLPIEDYAMIGDCVTAAMVGRNGSIDWLCWPRFDSAACFAALLGTSDNGRFLLAPAGDSTSTRRYLDGSLVLETLFETPDGAVAVIDFMIPGAADSTLIRVVEGRRGQVALRAEITLRFDYGSAVPWVTRLDGEEGVQAIAGPDMVTVRTDVPLRGEGMHSATSFTIQEGQRFTFRLVHSASHLPRPPDVDASQALDATLAFWVDWSGRFTHEGPWADQVKRSLIVLKGLTYAPTGGICAAVTTSLPEQLGGVRNWDYRYCWLRDATLVLFAFMNAGYYGEAEAWADWLHRSLAGSPSQVQIMYGIAGERRLLEWEVGWLPGYQGAAPVRIGNAAAEQLQLDVFGEVMDALHQARHGPIRPQHDETGQGWELQKALLAHLETVWRQPDEGLWESRGGRRQFTYSKVMAWVAFDRAIADVESFGFDGPVETWRALRSELHDLICREGYDATRNTFTQSFNDPALDASLLLIPFMGFLPHSDPRVVGTVRAIEADLVVNGFVLRYRTEGGSDGLPPGEGAFLPCSFWLAMALHQQDRKEEARTLFERLVGLCNDVGLLAEEYDPEARRFTGNIPQAFSHVALVAAASVLGDVTPSVPGARPREAGLDT